MTKKFIALCLITLITIPMFGGAATYKSYDELITIKQTAHEIANKAREIGLDDSHDIIVSAKRMWHEADDAINKQQYSVPITTYYEESWITYLAKTACAEAKGIKSITEIASVMWSIMNRYDAGQGTIENIVKRQYAYYSSAKTVSDYGYDLEALAEDVLIRWNKEKNGMTDVGRVLPSDYIYFGGDGKRNYFRNTYEVTGRYWDFSLPSPYES